ncbi:MAG: hypothetical protein ABI321_07720 [Polyangia bacterium]
MFLRGWMQRAAFSGLAVALALPSSAHAGVSLQAVVTASAGVTDNVASTPTVPQPGTRGRESDFLAVISPGLILAGGGPRAVMRLSYTFGGVIYGRNSDADTYTNTAALTGFFLPSKTTTIGVSLGLVQGRTSAFNTAIQSSSEPVQAQLSGVQNILSASANATLAWEITQNWRLYGLAGFSTSYYIAQTPVQAIAQNVPVTLGISRRFARDALSLEANLAYTNYSTQRGPVTTAEGRIDEDGVVRRQQAQILATPLARYTRDLTYFMSGRVELGANVVFDPANPQNNLVQAAGGAGFNFNSRLVLADISYRHGVAPNLLFLSNFLNDSATVRLNILLGASSGFSLQLTAGYTYGRQLDLSAREQAIAQTIIGDASIFYAPRKEFTFFLRYQLIDQYAHPVRGATNISNSGGTVEVSNLPALTTYYRNTVLFGVTAIYPAQSAAEVPRSTLGVRADRRDDGAISTSKSTPP